MTYVERALCLWGCLWPQAMLRFRAPWRSTTSCDSRWTHLRGTPPYPSCPVSLLYLLYLVLRHSLHPTQVQWTYPLSAVVPMPCQGLNLLYTSNYYTQPPSAGRHCLMLSPGGAPTHLLLCLLLAHAVLLVSSVYVWSRSLSFQWAGLWSAANKS